MGGMITVFLMGAQRIGGMMGGARAAFGGALLALGLLLEGIAIVAINIVILVKVIRMEKMLKVQGNKQIEQS